jgi:hypothetical protein
MNTISHYMMRDIRIIYYEAEASSLLGAAQILDTALSWQGKPARMLWSEAVKILTEDWSEGSYSHVDPGVCDEGCIESDHASEHHSRC